MKVLTLEKIREFINLLKKDAIPKETVYEYELRGNETIFKIPEYDWNKSRIEVYKNGFRLCIEREYREYPAGQIELLDTEYTQGDKLLVIHKKYS